MDRPTDWFDKNPSMASEPPVNPSADAGARPQHPHHDEWASHLAELGAMSQLYAHEVNNLLTQVSARAQLALMRPSDSDLAQHALRSVGDCCERINQLTQIFLSPDSAQNAGRGPIPREQMPAIHQRVLGTIRDADRARYGLELTDGSAGYAPDLLPVMLEQVLQNLILNALRAIAEHPNPTDQGHQIQITTHLRSREQCSTWNTPTTTHAIEIVVEDTGVGMNAQQVTQLMNGMRVDLSECRPSAHHSGRFSRHGLGIRVCRKLLGAVGGALACESTPMRGTRMIVRVPGVKLQGNTIRSAA